MKPELVNRIWTWLGLLTLSGALTAFLRTRGLLIDFALPGMAKLSIPDIVIVGFLVLAVLVLLLHWLLRVHARAYQHFSPTERLPLAFAKPENVDLGTTGGRAFVWAFFWLYAVVPIVCLALLMARLADGTVTYAKDGTVFATGIAQFWPDKPLSRRDWFGDQFRFEKGPSYVVWLTPYGYVALLVWCVVSAIRLRRYYR